MFCHRGLCNGAVVAIGLHTRLSAGIRPTSVTLFAVATARVAFTTTTRPQLSLRRTRVRLNDTNKEKSDQTSATAGGWGSSAQHEKQSHTNEGNAVGSQTSKEYGAKKDPGDDADDGFHEEAIVVKDDKGNSITRVRRLPLTLIEEVPLPQRILTELELIMMAWSEEHARQYGIILTLVRISIFVLISIVLYVFYRTQISSERVLRGVDNIPRDLKVGNVVYFDITEDGVDIGRIVIGLLTENCPLYCEYFHRRCTGSGGNGDSFRGLRMSAIVPRHCLIFGEGREMTHDVAGFNPGFLPTENISQGAWRGALSSITYGHDRESPNFVIHVSSGDYKPQVFAMIIGGYNVVERMNQAGSKHGNSPKREFVIQECGELCTLAKSHIIPMPWRLYESISKGFDAERFGDILGREVLEDSDARGAQVYATMHPGGDAVGAAVAGRESKKRKRFWIF